MDKKNAHETRKKASFSDNGNRKDCKSKEGATQNSKWNNPSERIYLPCSHYITHYQANKQAEEKLFTTIKCSQCNRIYPISVLESEIETDSLEAVKSSVKKNDEGNYSEVKRNSNFCKQGYHEGYQNYNSFHRKGQNIPKYNQNSEKAIKPSFVQDKKNVKNIENRHVLRKENGENLNKKIPSANSIPSRSDITKNSKDDSFHQLQKKRPSQWDQSYGNMITTPYLKNKNSAVNIETNCAGSNHKNNGDSSIKNCNKTSQGSDTNVRNNRKNSRDDSIQPFASKDQLQDLQKTTKIVVEENKESHNKVQGNHLKGTSTNQQSDYSESKRETIVNETKNVSLNNCCGCSLNNVSEHYLSGGLIGQMGCEVLSSRKQAENQLKLNVNQYEKAHVENVKETIIKQTEHEFSNNSKYEISLPIPAPRHVKSDGKTLVDNNSSAIIPNYSISSNRDSHSESSEKGAIRKTNTLAIINSNGKRAGDFELRPISDKLSNELVLYMCIDCAKSLPRKICQDHENKGHKVMNMKDGVNVLMNKELTTIQSMQNDMQNKFLEIYRHNTTLEASFSILPEIFKSFKERQIHPDGQKEKGNQILYQMQEISGKGISIESPTTFLQYENLRHSLEKTKIQAETWHEGINHMIPFWLISSWLKNSIAIMLHGAVTQRKEIYVVKGNKGEEMAKLCFLGNRLFLSPFCKNVTTKDNDYLIKHELVEPIFSNEVSLAFMKISYGNEESSEPIIIRVNNATFCGKQFLMMCTSESGNSYLGTKFFRNNWICKEGHHIWGGDYSNNDGSGGSVVMQDKDVSVEGSPLPLVEGMIASRFGYNDRSTIFRIYLQGSKSGFTESCAFAQIEEGIDILQCAAMMGDITKVTIVDVGIVAELI